MTREEFITKIDNAACDLISDNEYARGEKAWGFFRGAEWAFDLLKAQHEEEFFRLREKNAQLFKDQQQAQSEKHRLLEHIRNIESNPRPGEPEVELCNECDRWHVVGALTICKLKKAKAVLDRMEPC